mgnify:CR=1 FL=1
MNIYPLEYWENKRSEVCIEGVMSPSRCETGIELSKQFPSEKATVTAKREVDPVYRITDVTWLPWPNQEPRTEWIYDIIQQGAIDVNNEVFHFDMRGIGEQIQFTKYLKGGHYDWHMDGGQGAMSVRKFSMTLQLNSPSDYEGGELCFMDGKDVRQLKPEQGTATWFPSWMLHKVNPVTKGERNSLVVWITGRPYR